MADYRDRSQWTPPPLPEIDRDYIDSYDTAEAIRRTVREATGQKNGNAAIWPGAPIGWIPLEWAPVMREMITTGELVIVERPRVVNPDRVATFVCFPTPTQKGMSR